MNFVKSFNLFGTNAMQIPCITGTGSPTSSTVGAVGLLYMDTSTSDGELWKCTNVDGTSYTWSKLSEVATPDWNQSDSTAKDYIKNRPFYFKYNRMHSTDSDITISYESEYMLQLELGKDSFLEDYYDKPSGTLCLLVLDGKEYISKINNIYGYDTYIGNGYLLDTTLEDTGEDFYLQRNPSAMLLMITDNIAVPTSISVYEDIELCKIDKICLPSAIADYAQNDSDSVGYINNRPFYENIKWNLVHRITSIEKTGEHIGLKFEEDLSFLDDDDYCMVYGNNLGIVKVIIDDKEYISYIRNVEYNIYIGNGALAAAYIGVELENTGEDFCIYRCCASDMSIWFADSATPIPSIVEIYLGDGEFKKIDNKFLPNYRLVRSDDGLLYMTVDGSTVGNGIEVSSSGVLYTEQELTEEQKTQARANIGVSDEDIQSKVQAYVDEAILGGSW